MRQGAIEMLPPGIGVRNNQCVGLTALAAVALSLPRDRMTHGLEQEGTWNMKQLLPQQCPLPFLYLSWVVYIGGTVFLAATGDFALAGLWLIVLPTAWWLYVRWFPDLSPHLGYGRVDDEAPTAIAPHQVRVTMYSSLGCPFCPLVEERLRALQQEMGFELERVDVTLRPELLRAKSIRSVPVVEVGERRLVGAATTRELAELIGAARG